MTKVLVVRLDRKRIAGLNAAARKRSLTRSALVRQALDKFLAEETPTKGAGWAEHFTRLEKEGRKVSSKVVDEVIQMSRKREFP